MNARKLQLEQLLLHGAWLRRFTCALVRDEDLGDDLTQDTLVSAWLSPPPAEAKPKSWLARVAQNRARDLHRSDLRRRGREQFVSEGAAQAQTPEQLLGSLELHRQLAALVTALDEPFRSTVVWRYYEGLTAAQIAKRLDVPAGTVRWRVKEGLARLRSALDAEYGGNRKNWVLALAPFAPLKGRDSATRATPGPWLGAILTVAAIGAASMLLVTRHAPQHERRTSLGSNEREGLTTEMNAGATRTTTPSFHVVASEEEDEPAPDEGPAAADPESLIRYMLDAIAEGSYDDFLMYADNELKAHLDKETMGRASAEFGPRLRQGYTLHSFGSLQREAEFVHLWKLEFHDGGDDQLLRVIIKDGRASEFLIQ